MLDGDPAPPKRSTVSQLLAHVCCGQTAGWIKMPLGTKVGLVPGDIVLDGTQLPPKKRAHQPPTFRPTLLWHGRPYHSQQLLSSCQNSVTITEASKTSQRCTVWRHGVSRVTLRKLEHFVVGLPPQVLKQWMPAALWFVSYHRGRLPNTRPKQSSWELGWVQERLLPTKVGVLSRISPLEKQIEILDANSCCLAHFPPEN